MLCIIGCEAKMSVSGYLDRLFEPWLHQYVVVEQDTLSALLQLTHLTKEYQMGTPS